MNKPKKDWTDMYLLSETEYVDPDKSRCAECQCSFGVHLKTCTQFKGNSK